MTTARRRLDHVLDPEFVTGLDTCELDELRRRRRLADEVENELSYYRRLLHGRIDLLAFEQRRRRGEEQRSLIEALPDILSDTAHATEPRGRHLAADLPPLPELGRRDLDTVLGDDTLARLDEIDDGAIVEALGGLTEAEERVSEQRRAVQEVADQLALAVADRYRTQNPVS